MLRGRLYDFLYPLQIDEGSQHKLTGSILLYILGQRKAADLRALGHDFDITDPLYTFKSEYLDHNNYTISQFWRVVFGYYKIVTTPSIDGPTTTLLDRSVLEEAVECVPTIKKRDRRAVASDVMLMEDFTSLEDHRSVFQVAKFSRYATPTDLDLLPAIKKLQRYCASYAYQKMRFIAQNDEGLTLDDLSAELFDIALKALREYDSDPNELRLLNTAKLSARNHCQRLIDFHTAKKRERIVRIGSRKPPKHVQQICGTCAWFDTKSNGESCADTGIKAAYKPCRRKLAYHPRVITAEQVCGNCKFYDSPLPGAKKSCVNTNIPPDSSICEFFEGHVSPHREYQPTTASLDQELYEKSSGATMTLLDKQEDDKARYDEDHARQQWLDNLLGHLSTDQGRVVKIVLGDHDPEYEAWLWHRSKKTPESLSESATVRLACEFTSIPVNDMRFALRESGLLSASRLSLG